MAQLSQIFADIDEAIKKTDMAKSEEIDSGVNFKSDIVLRKLFQELRIMKAETVTIQMLKMKKSFSPIL